MTTPPDDRVSRAAVLETILSLPAHSTCPPGHGLMVDRAELERALAALPAAPPVVGEHAALLARADELAGTSGAAPWSTIRDLATALRASEARREKAERYLVDVRRDRDAAGAKASQAYHARDAEVARREKAERERTHFKNAVDELEHEAAGVREALEQLGAPAYDGEGDQIEDGERIRRLAAERDAVVADLAREREAHEETRKVADGKGGAWLPAHRAELTAALGLHEGAHARDVIRAVVTLVAARAELKAAQEKLAALNVDAMRTIIRTFRGAYSEASQNDFTSPEADELSALQAAVEKARSIMGAPTLAASPPPAALVVTDELVEEAERLFDRPTPHSLTVWRAETARAVLELAAARWGTGEGAQADDGEHSGCIWDDATERARLQHGPRPSDVQQMKCAIDILHERARETRRGRAGR